MSVKSEFKVNDYITLKLEDDGHEQKSVIYVAGERFRTCAYLLLVRPNELFQEEIESIDDAADQLDEILHDDEIRAEDVGLSPEQEFIGHCSNLQAWHEHCYDARLLHSNLAFPLLKRLKEAGDKSAAKKYYDELLDRYFHGNEKTRIFLEEEGYFKDIPKDVQLRILNFEEHNCIKTLEQTIGKKIPFFSRSHLLKAKIDSDSHKIEELYLNNQNKLKVLPTCLSKLSNLKKLSLNTHYLIHLPKWISELEKLEDLILSDSKNEMESIPLELFRSSKLKKLDLWNNNLRFIPSSLGNIITLEYLNIGNNPLDELPDSIGRLFNLKFLSLEKVPIEKLPESFIKLKSLKEVILSQTKLTTFPKRFGNLRSLKKLTIKDKNWKGNLTFIKSLPNSFGELESLEELFIQGGKLTELPASFGNLQKLKKLDLRGNKLNYLPSSFGNLKSLEWLDLSQNNIKKLPRTFNRLKKLKYLSLAANQLEEFPEVIKSLTSLEVLWLNKNQINQIPNIQELLPNLNKTHV